MARRFHLYVLALLAGCGEANQGADQGPATDLGLGADWGPDLGPDLGPPDLGPPDLGPPDLGPPDLGLDPTACNGDRRLCDRPFDAVAYLTTHNAMANTADGFRPPNHLTDVPTQLAAGARALMLDTYEEPDGLFLCHGFCALGRTPLVEGLQQIGTFLDQHPREVVSIIFEAYITPEQTTQAFSDAGLLPILHTQAPGEPWPTLGALIAADRRLVVFSDTRGGPAWHHHVWDFAWETHFHVEQVDAFDCAPNRGDPAHTLFILNHFITRPIAQQRFAEEANPTLAAHATRCQAETGRLPNFVTVDFYELGDPLGVVNALNGLSEGPEGR